MSNGFQKFISGKGFYLALAVCLAGAGAAAWVAVDKTIQSVEPAPMAEKPQLKQEQPYEPAKKQPAADTPSAQSDGDSSPSTQSQQLQITAETPEEDPSAQPDFQSHRSTAAAALLRNFSAVHRSAGGIPCSQADLQKLFPPQSINGSCRCKIQSEETFYLRKD